MYLHAYIRRLTKRDKSLPYRTLSTQYRNIAERFRPSCSSLTFIHLPYPYTPLQLAIFVSIPTRQPGVISILPIPRPYVSILVLPIIQAHAYYVQLVLFPHSNHPPPSTVRYSPSSAHSRLAHGACNFHVAPSSSFISVSLRIEPFHIHPFSFNSNGSRTSESARSFALSRARVGADEGERHPLKSSWEPITRVTQGRTHRVSTAPKILLRPRLIDRLKPKIMIVAARNESWKKGADGRLYAPVEGIKRLN